MALVALSEAQREVLTACARLHPSAVPLADALGLATSVSLVADSDVPGFASSAMDGFAVRAADTADAPVELDVIATTAAGAPPGPKVGAGEAVRIMTGAPMPAAANAVVMVERTEAVAPSRVRVTAVAMPGDHVRGVGDDVRAGDEVFPPGTVIEAGHLGVLASLGMRRVPVFPRVRVGVLSTGDELVDTPGALEPGQIRDANRHTLLALCRRSGFDAVDLGVVPDDPAQLRETVVRGAATCHAVLSSGGVSVGDFDHMKAVLDELGGGSFRWMQIAVKPAKPFAFGIVDGVPVFGLPGNPVSSMVSFELLARPALRQMGGFPDLHRPVVQAFAEGDLERRRDGKVHFARVDIRWDRDAGRFRVRSAGGQGSHLLRAMADANALAVLPDGDGVRAGELVDVWLLTYG